MSGSDISEYEGYRSPLSTRYATKEMQFLFSDQFKFSTWRKLWIFLAQAEKVRWKKHTHTHIELRICRTHCNEFYI